MAVGDVLRGQNVRVEVTIDGEVQSAFTTNVEATITPNLESDERNYQGMKAPIFRSVYNGVSMTLTSEPDSSDWLQLVLLQIAKAKQDDDALQKIVNVYADADYGNGDLIRIMLPDATYHSPSIPLPGRTDAQAISSGFSASEMVPI